MNGDIFVYATRRKPRLVRFIGRGLLHGGLPYGGLPGRK